MLCEFAVTGLVDSVAYAGTTVTLPCIITTNNKDIFSDHTHHEIYTITWEQEPVQTGSSNLLLTIEIRPGVLPRIAQTADGIKYVNYLQNASLKIEDIEFSDAGVYTCSITTVKNVRKASADLFVLLQPECRNLKPSLSFQVDEETFFDCVVHYYGNKPPVLLWKHDKQELVSKANRHNDSCVISTLSFRAITKYNGYRFQCIIEYPSAKFSSVCETSPPLQIYYPVHLVSMSIEPSAEKYVYKAGENIRLLCHANGNPQPKYSWYFKPTRDTTVVRKLTTEPRYSIFDAQAEDEGSYNCTVSNDVNGTMYRDSKNIYIKINVPSSSNGNYRFIQVDSKIDGEDEPQQPLKSAHVSPYAIGAIVCVVLAVILIVGFLVLAMKFRDQCFLMEMRHKQTHGRKLQEHDENMDDQEIELLDESVQPRMNNDEPRYGRLKLYWEIPRKDIHLTDQIAAGKFVEVWKGKMRRFPDSNEIYRIAIKKLKDDAVEQERKFFLDEMEVQKMLQPHPNVILLIGCYTFHEPWLLMLEYAQDGTLFQYLHQSRPGEQEVQITLNSVRHKNVNSHRLLAISAQIVNGLIHLLKFKLIYYRLKTSNILVGRGGICKLSGFGFPHDIRERNCYEVETLPVQWMSPESLQQDIYNYRTDIYSYGVLLWEVVHFGLTPYQGLPLSEVKDKIISGERLTCPPHCSESLYKLMLDCWHKDPMKRKEYGDILQELSNLASDHSTHIILDNIPQECRYQPSV